MELDQPLHLAEFKGSEPLENLQATCLIQARDAAIRLAATERARANALKENYTPLEQRLSQLREAELGLAGLGPLEQRESADEAVQYFSGDSFARSLAALGDFPSGSAAQKKFLEDATSVLTQGLRPLGPVLPKLLADASTLIANLPTEGTLEASAAIALRRLGAFCSHIIDDAALASERLQLAEIRIGILERDLADEKAKAARWQGQAQRAKAEPSQPKAGDARPIDETARESAMSVELQQLREQIAASRKRETQFAEEAAGKVAAAAQVKTTLEAKIASLEAQIQQSEFQQRILTPLVDVPNQLTALCTETQQVIGEIRAANDRCGQAQSTTLMEMQTKITDLTRELNSATCELTATRKKLEDQRNGVLEALRQQLAANPNQDLAPVVDELATELDSATNNAATTETATATANETNSPAVVIQNINITTIENALQSLEQRATRIGVEVQRAITTAVDSSRLQTSEKEIAALRASLSTAEERMVKLQEALDSYREQNRLLQQFLGEEQHKYAVLYDRRCDPSGSIENLEKEMRNYEKIALDLKRQQLCPLCQRNKRDICLRCGHTLCRECFSEQLRKERNRNCPFCQMHTGLNSADEAQAVVFQLKE